MADEEPVLFPDRAGPDYFRSGCCHFPSGHRPDSASRRPIHSRCDVPAGAANIGQRNGELSGGGRDSAGHGGTPQRSGSTPVPALPTERELSNSQRYARLDAVDHFKRTCLDTRCGLGDNPRSGWLVANGSARRGAAPADCPTGRSGPAAGGRRQRPARRKRLGNGGAMNPGGKASGLYPNQASPFMESDAPIPLKSVWIGTRSGSTAITTPLES